MIPRIALSLKQPWPYFIFDLPLRHAKRIENRLWNTSYRGGLWIHASKGMTRDYFYDACEFAMGAGVPRDLLPSFDGLKRSAIIGRVVITDVMLPGGLRWVERKKTRHPRAADAWYMPEQHGILIDEVESVPAVTCAGARGFWKVLPETLEQLLRST